jgi:hypothetical protein
MSETTEIEKKSLEAHVELCAQRYKILETKLLEVESDIKEVKTHVSDIGEKIDVMSNKRTDQVIAWGVGIIGFLGATVMWLLQQYVFK